jgi:drug/metabolite transporter (DMT)-like permease
MTLGNLLLLLAAAGVHVITHIALKRSRDRSAFVGWMLLWAAILFSPILLLNRAPIPPIGWGLMLFSSVFEAGYFIAIALAYRGADLSVVYPLARGTGPVLLLVWSALILREPLTAAGGIGVALIALGLYVINLPRLGAWRQPLAALRQSGPRWALAAGACISGYTAIDKVGIGYVPPLLYTYLALWITLLWVGAWTLWHVGRRGLLDEWRLSRVGIVVAGFTTLSAYGLVLLAMAGGTPASYAGAIREVSVVLGAAYGVFVLKEQGGPMRLAGAGLVAAGVAAIGLLG